MATFLAVFEYQGGPYHGWQRQTGLKTVQGEIEAALRILSGRPTTIQACGRTDAGVHALAMPVSFDLAGIDANALRERLNGLLAPQPIACLDVYAMPAGFNARFDCLDRAYEYRILARRAPAALDRGAVHSVRVPLDMAAMQAGAAYLIGRHDFSTFRSKHCQADSPQKTLDTLEIHERNGRVIIQTRARSFLHHQVRLMVGSLIQVGKGHWRPRRMGEALRAADPRACGPLVAAEGLYFVRGTYADLPCPGPYTSESSTRFPYTNGN